MHFPFLSILGRFYRPKTDCAYIMPKHDFALSSYNRENIWINYDSFPYVKAAHCGIDRISGKPVAVLVGVLNTKSENGTIIDVDELVMHPAYKSVEKYNDIALVRLKSHINFNERIRPACLPTRNVHPRKMIAIGFGKTEFG